MLLNSHISAYATCFAGKVCGPVRSTWGTSQGEDRLGARGKILNTRVARRACARQTFPQRTSSNKAGFTPQMPYCCPNLLFLLCGHIPPPPPPGVGGFQGVHRKANLLLGAVQECLHTPNRSLCIPVALPRHARSRQPVREARIPQKAIPHRTHTHMFASAVHRSLTPMVQASVLTLSWQEGQGAHRAPCGVRHVFWGCAGFMAGSCGYIGHPPPLSLRAPTAEVWHWGLGLRR